MDPNHSDDFDELFWQIIEEELMNNTEEEYMMLILERQMQQEANSSTKRRRRRHDFTTMPDTVKENMARMAELMRIFEENKLKKKELMAEMKRIKDEENKLKHRGLQLEKEEMKMKELEILFKYTSRMSETQLQDYEIQCNMIRELHGIN